ncbi:hypothetical protein Tco_0505755 [Tanacetum coccineum]
MVADALSKKERVKPKRVRTIAMTIQSGVKGMILAAQGEAFDQENIMDERLHGSVSRRYKNSNYGSYIGNYMPSRPDLSFAGLDDSVYKTKMSETITTASKTSKDSLENPKTVRPSAWNGYLRKG